MLLQFTKTAQSAGCPRDQLENFIRAGLILQPRQLAASAAARRCDLPDGPSALGYGGARGGGKSFWLLAQMGADDCQRFPGLKCLLLRKVGKSNLESFEDLRQRLFHSLNHTFNASRGILTFENGSRIVAKHYQHEKEIDSFLGLEYDVIGIEEATTLTYRKYQDISTCCRSSRTFPTSGLLSTLSPQSAIASAAADQLPTTYWRPRIYSTTNPGGIGHDWYKRLFIDPQPVHHPVGMQSLASPSTPQPSTVFIPARIDDNKFTNPEYRTVLENRTGWQKDAWFHGRWDIAAGQFFSTFRHKTHVVSSFDESRAVKWFAAMDYGYTHFNAVLLACTDPAGHLYIVDEHVERLWIPQRHILAIKSLFQRHQVVTYVDPRQYKEGDPWPPRRLVSFVAGPDVFSTQYDGGNISSLYAKQGLRLRPANNHRVQGWAEILNRLGDPDNGIPTSLFIHARCQHLLDCLPYLQHDPDHPADVLKTNTNEEGLGGDDTADALRYLVATKHPDVSILVG